MKQKTEIIKKTLDLLLEKAETLEDYLVIKYTIDDYLEEGYKIKEYISKFNEQYRKFHKELSLKN